MTSATDIITYIGVPLAVLGVLPILYTFMLGILTQRRIRSTLVHHGHKPLSSTRPHDGFTIRSSPMTSLIEVELPRYTIAPLERNDADYWRTTDEGYDKSEESHGLLARQESTLSMIEEGRVRGFLRGGSWRAFQWKKLLVGRKLYRIQYEDELREPPAEIDFSDLVHFLLDWGAVPDAMGWEKLKSGGLWTPTGTILLRKPQDDNDSLKNTHVDWVLRTNVPDESDGVLSLTIRWTTDMESVVNVRGAASLPPGWGRIDQPRLLETKDRVSKDRKDLPARIEELKTANEHSIDSSSFRFRADNQRVQRLHWEEKNIETGFVDEPFRTQEAASAALWFTCTASTIISQRQSGGGLWGFEIPTEIATFVHKDTVPCGVLVSFGLLPETDAPQWMSESSAMAPKNFAAMHHERFLAEKAAERLEATMPPEQARMHRANREAEARRTRHQDMQNQIAEVKERTERRIKDAIASPRMSNRAVAEGCLAWLIEQGEVGREWTVEQLAEAVLYLIVVDNPTPSDAHSTTNSTTEGKKVIQILDEWMNWSCAGGMKKQQYHMLEDMKVEFCFAAALVATVQAVGATHMGKAGADMLDCVKLWRKVRLG